MRSLFAATFVLAAGACAPSADAPPEGNPAAPIRQDLRGRTYAPDAMAAPGGAFLWAQTAISGYRQVDEKATLSVETLPQAACALPRPAAGTTVRHVHLERGVQAAPLYQFSSRDVDSRAKSFVESYVATKGRMQGGGGYVDGDVVRVVNVAVTERAAPVALVLSAETNIVWNILPAPDVRIESILLVGMDGAGVANAPESANVFALAGDAARGCGAWPMRRPQKDWGFVRNVEKSGASTMRQALADNMARAGAYARFLEETYGPGAGVDAVVLQGASNVLVGPAPTSSDARVAYRPIGAAAVRMSAEDYRVDA
ncbi:MAG: hypothetical protein K2Q06_10470, partial [Parvularculaceae bacterium]|nr:hypothetical protein [Parvularculaceae bacterium]